MSSDSTFSVVPSSAPLVYLSSIKDNEYIQVLSSALKDVAQLKHPFGIGGRLSMKLVPEIDTFARFLYYYSMYCLGNRTLGQDYCQLIPVTLPSLRKPVSLGDGRRLLLVLAHTLLPYLYHQCQQQQFRINNVGSRSNSPDLPNPTASVGFIGIMRILKVIKKFISSHAFYSLYRLHLVQFFLNGQYRDVVMRLFGIRLVRNSKFKQPNSRYKFIGLVLSVELLIQLSQYWSWSNTTSTESENNSEYDSDKDSETGQGHSFVQGGDLKKCVLCMGPRQNTSATECGHLFCWSCIMGWCASTGSTRSPAECPLCRAQVNPKKVLTLQY